MAGVILVENYKNKFGKQDYAIILFKNIYKNVYEDPGGHLMPKKTIEESAMTELIEESCNTFRINPKYLINHIVSNNYHSFLLYIKGPIYSKYYNHNKILIHNNKTTPYQYKETNNIRRFYISDLLNCGLMINKGDLVCNDSNGYIRKISGRTKSVIRSFIGNKFITFNNNKVEINVNPIQLKINNNFTSKTKPFLNGTISYYI